MLKHNQGVLNIIHLLPPEVRESVNRDRVGAILGSLSDKESRALELRFGLYDGEMHSYESIGDHLNMSSMGAMKLFKRTVKKLVDDTQERAEEENFTEASEPTSSASSKGSRSASKMKKEDTQETLSQGA